MEIRRYKKGDDRQILDLFKQAFGKTMDPEYWVWRFANNPFTDKQQIHLMWEGDLLVGHYAVSPVEMLVEGEVKKTALSMTTMTHPDFGGKGIFTLLAESLYTQLAEDGYSFVWGFPNNKSHYGFIKNLGWKDVAAVPLLSLKINDFKKYKVTNTAFELHERIADTWVDKINTAKKRISINKSIDFLNWRYVNNPSADYKIITVDNSGLVIYKIIDSFGNNGKKEVDIMELAFGNSLEVLVALINAIIQNEELELEKVNLWSSLFSSDYQFLEKLGFSMSLPITYFGYRSLLPDAGIGANFSDWDLSFGYSDVF